MTAITLHRAAPTPFERALQRIGVALVAHVERRVADRAHRRQVALDLLREQQTRRQDPRAVDHMLAQLGIRER